MSTLRCPRGHGERVANPTTWSQWCFQRFAGLPVELMIRVDKADLLAALRARVAENLAALTASQNTVQAGAIHEETRQEDPKDTRAIEAQYLARGLAERVESMKDDVAMLATLSPREFGDDAPIALTALVELAAAAPAGDAGSAAAFVAGTVYFLVPCSGGERLEIDGVTVHCVTPQSPIGAELIGRRVDDDVELELPGGRVRAEVEWVG